MLPNFHIQYSDVHDIIRKAAIHRRTEFSEIKVCLYKNFKERWHIRKKYRVTNEYGYVQSSGLG